VGTCCGGAFPSSLPVYAVARGGGQVEAPGSCACAAGAGEDERAWRCRAAADARERGTGASCFPLFGLSRCREVEPGPAVECAGRRSGSPLHPFGSCPVYGRITGHGQEGPLASVPGHDINYIASSASSARSAAGERPVPPLNLVGDYGGGTLLALGVVAGLLERSAPAGGRSSTPRWATGPPSSRQSGSASPPPGRGGRQGRTFSTPAPLLRRLRILGRRLHGGLRDRAQFYADLLSHREIDPADAPQRAPRALAGAAQASV
jgi:CoA-transferase family III